MSRGEIDRLPVSQLTDRYGIVRSAIYTRLNALNIEPEKVGNKAYVNAQQLALLDELHEFINRGGTTAEFLDRKRMQGGEYGSSNASTGQSGGLSAAQPDMVQLVTSIAAQIAAQFRGTTAESDPLAYFKALEQAASNGWLLRTSEVAYLLDLLPSDIMQYGEYFTEAGFVFSKAGYRSGGEVAWRVSKQVR